MCVCLGLCVYTCKYSNILQPIFILVFYFDSILLSLYLFQA